MTIEWTQQDYENLRTNMGHLRMVLSRSREWHDREQINSRGCMHSAIKKAIGLYPPDNWHLLVLEWAHHADSDPSRVAYTQNDRKGESDIQTVTSVGKYLRRHFSLMPDHTVRDIAAMFTGHSYEILRTMPEMLRALKDAPSSCMNNHMWANRDWDEHPYNVYDPQYGWALAVSRMGDKVTGRCLVNEDGNKTFVRSYNDGESFSYSNEGLEMWLRENGYTKSHSWAGCKFKRIERRGYCINILAPYLDGDDKDIIAYTDHCEIVESGDGEYVCESTDGGCEEQHSAHCDHCDEGCDEGDLTAIGYHADSHVCEGCLDYQYVHAIGRNADSYYVHRDDAVYVESQDSYYVEYYLEENDIVYIDDCHEYFHRDDTVHLDSRNVTVHMDYEFAVYCDYSDTHEHINDCVQLADGESYALIDDAHLCEHSNDWYLDEVLFAETPCGKMVHPDYYDLYTQTLQAA